MTLFKSPIVVLDCETSGFMKYGWANVIELAGVLLDVEGEEVDFFESLVAPPTPIPTSGRDAAEADKALAISGITRAQLERAPSVNSVHWAWSEWLDEHQAKYVTAYNRSFDEPMVEQRLGLRPMTWAPCIMLAAMKIMGPAGALRPASPSHPAFDPERPWLFPPLVDKVDPKTGETIHGAAQFFGVHVDHQTHRALDDARVAAAIVIEIRKRQLSAMKGAA